MQEVLLVLGDGYHDKIKIKNIPRQVFCPIANAWPIYSPVKMGIKKKIAGLVDIWQSVL
jgi:hypothetical protein